MNSKALNIEALEIKRSAWLPEWVENWIVFPIQDFTSKYKERIGRSYAYAKIGWLNYDFDASCAWELAAFKLKRVRRTLQKGTAVQEAEDMAALDEVIQIFERMSNDGYEDKHYEAHYAKWGQPEFSTEKGNFEIVHEKVKTSEDKNQMHDDLRVVWKNIEKDRHADADRLAEIIKKHARTWWD